MTVEQYVVFNDSVMEVAAAMADRQGVPMDYILGRITLSEALSAAWVLSRLPALEPPGPTAVPDNDAVNAARTAAFFEEINGSAT